MTAARSSTDLALRGGTQVGLLQHEDTRLVCLGAGLALPPDYALDYALISMGALGLSHRFSLTLQLPRARPRPRPAQRATKRALWTCKVVNPSSTGC